MSFHLKTHYENEGKKGRSPRSVSASSTTARVGLFGVALSLHKIVNAKKLLQVFAIFLNAFPILQAPTIPNATFTSQPITVDSNNACRHSNNLNVKL